MPRGLSGLSDTVAGPEWAAAAGLLLWGFRDRARVRKRPRRGLARIAGGTLRYAVGRLVASDRHEARGLRTVRRGQGMLSGARGTRFDEYARSVP